MLKTVDILIGISLVMLLVSMIVTVVTQFVIHLLSLRGKHLLTGIANLLSQIDRNMPPQIRREIASKILSHPLVQDASGRLGSVIHREELTKLLLELGAGDGPQRLSEAARAQLVQALAANGMGQPDDIKKTLDNVRALTLQLELAHPELTNAARERVALLQQANSQLIGKINLWFDQTMDRVSASFTANTRYVTFVVGLAIAVVLQLDTAALVNRLSVDTEARQFLVNRAIQIDDSAKQGAAQPAPASGANAAAATTMDFTADDQQAIRDLMMNNLLGIPQSGSDWVSRWSSRNWPMKSLGILLTALLLSLGAPFWYNALQNLVRLRSVIAGKDDAQRQERQTTPSDGGAPAPSGGSGSPPSAPLTDERGDLGAAA